MRDEEMLAEIEDFIEGFNQPTYRGMRINGQRVATWSSEHGWSGLREDLPVTVHNLCGGLPLTRGIASAKAIIRSGT
jgi:hypothetical protein